MIPDVTKDVITASCAVTDTPCLPPTTMRLMGMTETDTFLSGSDALDAAQKRMHMPTVPVCAPWVQGVLSPVQKGSGTLVGGQVVAAGACSRAKRDSRPVHPHTQKMLCAVQEAIFLHMQSRPAFIDGVASGFGMGYLATIQRILTEVTQSMAHGRVRLGLDLETRCISLEHTAQGLNAWMRGDGKASAGMSMDWLHQIDQLGSNLRALLMSLDVDYPGQCGGGAQKVSKVLHPPRKAGRVPLEQFYLVPDTDFSRTRFWIQNVRCAVGTRMDPCLTLLHKNFETLETFHRVRQCWDTDPGDPTRELFSIDLEGVVAELLVIDQWLVDGFEKSVAMFECRSLRHGVSILRRVQDCMDAVDNLFDAYLEMLQLLTVRPPYCVLVNQAYDVACAQAQLTRYIQDHHIPVRHGVERKLEKLRNILPPGIVAPSVPTAIGAFHVVDTPEPPDAGDATVLQQTTDVMRSGAGDISSQWLAKMTQSVATTVQMWTGSMGGVATSGAGSAVVNDDVDDELSRRMRLVRFADEV